MAQVANKMKISRLANFHMNYFCRSILNSYCSDLLDVCLFISTKVISLSEPSIEVILKRMEVSRRSLGLRFSSRV